MIISNEELNNVIGGASNISGTLINSIVKLIETLLDLGRSIGSAVRYKKSNITCSK